MWGKAGQSAGPPKSAGKKRDRESGRSPFRRHESDFIYTKNSARPRSDFLYTKNAPPPRADFLYTHFFGAFVRWADFIFLMKNRGDDAK